MLKKIKNYVKSIPTRVAARRETKLNTYNYKKIGTELHRFKKANPTTSNKASTGIRKKK